MFSILDKRAYSTAKPITHIIQLHTIKLITFVRNTYAAYAARDSLKRAAHASKPPATAPRSSRHARTAWG